MTDKGKKGKELKFEASLKRLEEIVTKLEEGDLELEKSIELFEEGMKMASGCQKRLDEAEKKVEKLIKGADGSFATESMETDDSEGEIPF
jgi:exodeoxyribonuclease VII small subunit